MSGDDRVRVDAADLIGGWQLECWSFVYEDGRADEFPLGADAIGRILYTPDGHVSATLARDPNNAHDAERASFAYAGRYTVQDGCVFHTIEVCSDPALIGRTTMRRINLAGDRLLLQGHDFTAGSGRTQRIAWQRARAPIKRGAGV